MGETLCYVVAMILVKEGERGREEEGGTRSANLVKGRSSRRLETRSRHVGSVLFFIILSPYIYYILYEIEMTISSLVHFLSYPPQQLVQRTCPSTPNLFQTLKKLPPLPPPPSLALSLCIISFFAQHGSTFFR